MKTKLSTIINFCLLFTILIIINCESGTKAKDDTQKLYTIDLKTLSDAEKMLVKSIQGLIHQKIRDEDSFLPMIYTFNRESDDLWIEDYLTWFDFEVEEQNILSLYRFAIKHIDSYVLWDPSKSWTINIASTYAAQNQSLLLTPELAQLLGTSKTLKMDFTQQEWAYPDLESGTKESISGKAAGYSWAMNHLLDGSDNTKLIYLKESIVELKDLIFLDKVFAINLDPLNNVDEIQILEDVLSKFSTETPVLGWADASYARGQGQDNVTVEKALVSLLSKNNDFLIPADYANNLSFHSLFDLPTPLEQEKKTSAYESGNKYVCFIMSDGDNIQYDMNMMKNELWSHEYRGKVPISWTISPSLITYAPFAAWSYYNSAEESGFNDTFIAGPSGYAYALPSLMDETSLLNFIEKTETSMKEMDLTCLASIDKEGKETETYQKYVENSTIHGVFMVGKSHKNYQPGSNAVFSDGIKKMGYSVETLRVVSQSSDELIRQIKNAVVQNPFVMIYIHCWDDNMDEVYEAYQNLSNNNTIHFVGAHEFMDCLKQAE